MAVAFYKVWDANRSLKRIVIAKNLEELRDKGCAKLGIELDGCQIVDAVDGSVIDEDDILLELRGHILMLLSKNEKWTSPVDDTAVTQAQNNNTSTPTALNVVESGDRFVNSNEEGMIMSVPCTPSSSTPRTVGFLGPYVLPKFPVDLNQALINKDASLLVTRCQRSKIVATLFEDLLQKVGRFPSGENYNSVCRALVNAYPFLEDKFKSGKPKNGLRFDTWKESLKQKFKDYRRPLISDAEVLALKAKFGRKALKRLPEEVESEVPKSKRPKANVNNEPDGEDEESLALHAVTLQSSDDNRVVEDRMQRTFKLRRDMVEKGSLITTILEQYPPLRRPSQIQKEADQILGMNLGHKIDAFFTPKRTDTILGAATGVEAAPFVREAKKTNINDVRRTCALAALPSLFGRKMLDWVYLTTDDYNSVYPTAIVDTSANDFDIDHTELKVCCNRHVVFDGHDLGQALLACYCLYYVFDLQFPSSLKSFFCFLEHFIFGIPSRGKVPPAVQKVANKIL